MEIESNWYVKSLGVSAGRMFYLGAIFHSQHSRIFPLCRWRVEQLIIYTQRRDVWYTIDNFSALRKSFVINISSLERFGMWGGKKMELVIYSKWDNSVRFQASEWWVMAALTNLEARCESCITFGSSLEGLGGRFATVVGNITCWIHVNMVLGCIRSGVYSYS